MQPTPTSSRSKDTGAIPLSFVFGVIAALIVVALVLPKLIGGRDGSALEQEEVAKSEAPRSTSNRLDPTPFRPQIVQLEQQLYRESPGGFDDAGRVSALARDLSLAVRGDGRDLARLKAWGELFDYAGEVDAQADVGYTTANLPQLRAKWEQVRNEVFAPADWFRNSSATLTRSQTRTAPTANPTTVRGLRDAVNQLSAMIRTGRREALAIPEAGVDAALNSPEARQAERRWQEWSNSWLSQLDGVVQYLPTQPGPNANVDVSMAYQELSRAIGELRFVTMTAATTTTIPFLNEREQHFDVASQYLNQAGSYLDKLGN